MKKILVAGCIDLDNYKMKPKSKQLKPANLFYWNDTWTDELAFNPSQMEFICDWLNNIQLKNQSIGHEHYIHKPDDDAQFKFQKYMKEVINRRSEPRLICIDSYAQLNEQ